MRLLSILRGLSDADAKAKPIALRTVVTSPAALVATEFGLGLFPFWPGTIGSAVGLPVLWLLSLLTVSSRIAIYVLAFAALAFAAQRAASVLGVQDHRSVICDETWAMAVTWELTPKTCEWMAASFLAFRALDVIKPWPISTVDRSMKTGVGVMLDDAIAALYAIVLVTTMQAILTANR